MGVSYTLIRILVMNDELTFDKSWKKSKRIWLISTLISIIGFILIVLGNYYFLIPENFTIALVVITVAASLYSLWLIMFFISGFIWGVARSINPIVSIIAIVIIPLLIIPLAIGWYADEVVNDG